MKFDLNDVPWKNTSSTLALSKPDIGPTSRPRARAAIISQAPCSVLLRSAYGSAESGWVRKWVAWSPAGNSRERCSKNSVS